MEPVELIVVAEGVVFVGVRDGTGGVGQLPHASAAVIAIEARRPGARDDLLLADALQAVGVLALDCAGPDSSSTTCG